MANFAFFIASQAILLAIVLSTLKTGNVTANRLLAGFLLSGSSYFLGYTLAANGVEFKNPGPYFLLGSAIYCCPPLLMLYARALTTPGFRVQPAMAWHLVPMLFFMLVALQHSLLMQGIEPHYTWRPQDTSAFRKQIRGVFQVSFLTSLVCYGLSALRLLRNHRCAIREIASSLEEINLRWLQMMVTAAVAIGAVGFCYSAVGYFTDGLEGSGLLVFGFFSVFFYAISFAGIRQAPIFVGEFKSPVVTPREGSIGAEAVPIDVSVDTLSQAQGAAAPSKKYTHSSLAPDLARLIWQRLEVCMCNDRLYLRPGLRIAELAEHLAVSVDHLSQTINLYSDGTFFDYINRYRLQDTMRRLQDPALAQVSVLDIALGAGFNSLSSFYELFKAETGMTPAKFRKARLLSA